ncbi:LysR family transcriptional regulator [Cellvibrio sp.]|uniref:LysR family transcriptional regulator n=1 Tax=Cellvibrio sp. TaxID=1965322 RepID=UPI0039647A22
MGFNNLEEIRIFNQVVLSKGFSAASEILRIPTNIVSRKVAALENQLGVKLLNRTTRKISLTSEGDLLFNRSIELLQHFDSLAQELSKTQTDICGTIRIAVRTTTVEFGLLDAITHLLTEHSSLEIQLIVSDTPRDIVGEGIDLALLIGELPDSLLVAKKIGEVVFCLCAAPKYLAASTSITTPEQLTHYNYILPWQKKLDFRLSLRHKNGDITQITPQSRFQSNDVRTRAAAVYAGLGVGALPIAEVKKKAEEGKLVRVLPDYTLPFISVWCVKAKEKKDDPRLRLIEDALIKVVAKMGSADLFK